MGVSVRKAKDYFFSLDPADTVHRLSITRVSLCVHRLSFSTTIDFQRKNKKVNRTEDVHQEIWLLLALLTMSGGRKFGCSKVNGQRTEHRRETDVG